MSRAGENTIYIRMHFICREIMIYVLNRYIAAESTNCMRSNMPSFLFSFFSRLEIWMHAHQIFIIHYYNNQCESQYARMTTVNMCLRVAIASEAAAWKVYHIVSTSQFLIDSVCRSVELIAS